MFILERIKNATKGKKEIEEIEPDEIDLDDELQNEPVANDDDFDFDELEGEDESQDEDDLIAELHSKYKKLKRLYEHRLHQRKSR